MSKGKTILLVEDELTLAETLRYNLEREGYSVLTAAVRHQPTVHTRIGTGRRFDRSFNSTYRPTIA